VQTSLGKRGTCSKVLAQRLIILASWIDKVNERIGILRRDAGDRSVINQPPLARLGDTSVHYAYHALLA
jgi:hypothetical protein